MTETLRNKLNNELERMEKEKREVTDLLADLPTPLLDIEALRAWRWGSSNVEIVLEKDKAVPVKLYAALLDWSGMETHENHQEPSGSVMRFNFPDKSFATVEIKFRDKLIPGGECKRVRYRRTSVYEGETILCGEVPDDWEILEELTDD